jgi:hypothetical protein
VKYVFLGLAAFGVGWCVGGLTILCAVSFGLAAKSDSLELRAIDLSAALRAGDPAEIVLRAQLLDDEVAHVEGAR